MTNIDVKHSHYKKDVSHLKVLDVYRIQELWKMHACAEHVVKKMLVAGGRGHKDLDKDIQDCIDTLQRWQEMRKEDAALVDATSFTDGVTVKLGTFEASPYLYNWSVAPNQYKWCAADKDGAVHAYTREPSANLQRGEWTYPAGSEVGSHEKIKSQRLPTGMSWYQSLEARP